MAVEIKGSFYYTKWSTEKPLSSDNGFIFVYQENIKSFSCG
jgi:hypothetical protein